MKNFPVGAELFAKPEIINISSEFVAVFEFQRRKIFAWNIGQQVWVLRTRAGFTKLLETVPCRFACGTAEGGRGHMSRGLAQIHDHEFRLSHLFDGIAQTFAAET